MILRRPSLTLLSDRYSLGHELIDSDHLAIADCWLQAMRCSSRSLLFHIARLRKLMGNHFSNEATLVEAAGVPFCECHQQEHDTMLRLCDDAYALSAEDARGARALLRNKLPKLVRDHIVTMDQISVLIINTATLDRPAAGPAYL